MQKHKDLPGGSQAWADEVDRLMDEVKQLKEVVKRLSQNAGLDFSNPGRGINPGDTPSIGNPVGQKLSSLADVQTYNVADGQYLSWSQQGQKWLPITPPAAGSSTWQLATELEHLYGDLDSDSDYTSTEVMGLRTSNSYGLVGSSTTSAFLHGSKHSTGSQSAHAYVTAQPYYVNMAVVWTDDDPSVRWINWGEMGIDRMNLYFRTPQYQKTFNNPNADDGQIIFFTNWFYVPQFASSQRPIPPSNPADRKGTMIYDTTLNIPLWFNGTAWTNALGTAV